jgi:hypothetical protein
MATNIPRKTSSWGGALIALCVGLVAGHQLSTGQSFTAAYAATSLTPVDKLLAEDEIRQQIALYGLYADGDGAGGNPRDLRKMADTLMTPDVVSEIYVARGGPPRILTGRDIVAKSPPENDPDRAKRIAGRHYLVATVFDDVSATTAETRTTAVYFDATKNQVGGDCAKAGEGACGGQPVKTVMWVYHMTWKHTPQGWQISRNVLRDDN